MFKVNNKKQSKNMFKVNNKAISLTLFVSLLLTLNIILSVSSIVCEQVFFRTINIAKVFEQVQNDNFYSFLKMIKKDTKIQFALLL